MSIPMTEEEKQKYAPTPEFTEEYTKLYGGLGRKCPNCECRVSSEEDWKGHQRVCRERKDALLGWRKGSFGDDEYVSVDKDPELVAIIRRNGGHVVMAKKKYRVSPNGKWLLRSDVPFT